MCSERCHDAQVTRDVGGDPPAGRPGRGDAAPRHRPWAAVVPYRTSLRVYEPDGAVGWADTPRPEAVPISDEPLAAFRRLIGTPPTVAPATTSGAAYLLTAGRQRFWCPVDERQRCWSALRAARDDGATLLRASFPPHVLDDADADYERWSGAHPDTVPHVRTSSWHVPIRWFAAFEDGERVVERGPEPSVVYRTTMVQARRRLSRTHALLRRTAPRDRLTGAVRDLGSWVNEFHPRGVLELDYGGLVELLGLDEVAGDPSVASMQEVFAALGDGRDRDAWSRYRTVVDRWRSVQRMSRAS